MGPWLKMTAILYVLFATYGIGESLLNRVYRRCVQTCRTNVECIARCDAAAGIER